jgi:hypothetical protein
MSLVNVKHLVTPFQNWVHLILIILMAFLFAAYRWAGGRIELRSATDGPILRYEDGGPSAQQPTRVVLPEMNQRPKSAENGGDLLNDFVAKTAPKPKDSGRGDNASLSDLERQLGLK